VAVVVLVDVVAVPAL